MSQLTRRALFRIGFRKIRLSELVGSAAAIGASIGVYDPAEALATDTMPVPVYICDNHGFSHTSEVQIRPGRILEVVIDRLARQNELYCEFGRIGRWHTRGKQLFQLGRWRNWEIPRRRNKPTEWQRLRYWTLFVGPSMKLDADGTQIPMTPADLLQPNNVLPTGASITRLYKKAITGTEILVPPMIAVVFSHPDEPPYTS